MKTRVEVNYCLLCHVTFRRSDWTFGDCSRGDSNVLILRTDAQNHTIYSCHVNDITPVVSTYSFEISECV